MNFKNKRQKSLRKIRRDRTIFPLPGDGFLPSVLKFLRAGTTFPVEDVSLSTFVGRNRELAYLKETLESAEYGGPAAPALFLKGPEGSGRRTLVRELWKHIENHRRPRLLLWLERDWQDPRLGRLLWDDIEAAGGFGRDAIATAQESWQADEAVRTTGSLAERLRQWADFLADQVLASVAQTPQVLLVIPGFDMLSPPDRQLLAEHLYAPLAESSADLRVFMTGEHAPTDQPDLLRHWESIEPSLQELELTPLETQEIREWLEAREQNPGLAEAIREHSGGWPGQLEAALSEHGKSASPEENTAQIKALLDKLPSSQRDYLEKAAHLTECSREGLRLFYADSAADAAYEALRDDPLIHTRESSGALRLDPALRRGILEFCEETRLSVHRATAIKCAKFNEACQQLPSRAAREQLSRVAVFNYFDAGLVESIYREESADLLAFVQNHPEFFERTEANWRLHPRYRAPLEEYERLVGRSPERGLKQRIEEAWKRQREGILASMKEIEDKAAGEEAAVATLQAEVRTIQSQIAKQEKVIRKARERPAERSRPARRKTASKSLGTSISMQLAGTLVLYIGILFSADISLIYAFFGVGLILGGLFLQSRRAPAPVTSRPAAPPPLDTSRYEKSVHLLNLKRNQIQMRMATANRKLQDLRAEINLCDTRLREPYS